MSGLDCSASASRLASRTVPQTSGEDLPRPRRRARPEQPAGDPADQLQQRQRGEQHDRAHDQHQEYLHAPLRDQDALSGPILSRPRHGRDGSAGSGGIVVAER
jgi:hypothetical protein